jgi:SH3-like domain-containing protein
MTIKGSSRTLTILWRVTAGVAVLLLIFTVILIQKVQSGPSVNFTGTVNSQGTTVYLRNQPSGEASIIAILDHGTVVEVDRSTTREDVTWYHVKTDSGRGWIPEANLDLSK